MAFPCYAHFSLLQIGTSVKGGHVHVTPIFHCLKLEPVLRDGHLHVPLIFHGFKLVPVLGEDMCMLRSSSMDSTVTCVKGDMCMLGLLSMT